MEILIKNAKVLIDGVDRKLVEEKKIKTSDMILFPQGEATQISVDSILSELKTNNIKHGRIFLDSFEVSEVPVLRINNENYSWYGLQLNKKKMPKIKGIDQSINIEHKETLPVFELETLSSIWERDYFGSDFLKRKENKVLRTMKNSYKSVVSSKLHWIVKIADKIVGHVSIKTFYFPWTKTESGALHIWIDPFVVKETRKEIHKQITKQVIENFEMPLFAGVSVENIRAVKCLINYGFEVFQLDIKFYE